MSINSSPPEDKAEPDDAETIREPFPREAFSPTSITEVMDSLGDDRNSQEALASLCEKYWYPLYAFLRSRGHPKEAAQDITQGFFAKFLSGRGFAEFDPKRGKLRTYMLGALKHYELSDRREKETLKRGGGFEFVSFDWMNAERWYGAEPLHIDSPALIFDRRWAITLLAGVHERLQASYEKKGKGALFEALHVFLDGRPAEGSQEEFAARLGMTRDAAKMAISRMRDRRRHIMRAEIGKTVGSPELIDGEISHLISLFQSSGGGGRPLSAAVNRCLCCGGEIPEGSPAWACPVCALKSAYTAVDDLEGRVVGPYTIIEQIGRGGFGVVYLAGQSTPVRRHVALKILSRGRFDERMKGQFLAEQQLLALMNHPNIAKIFDAGETQWGMPYFVMELIEGEPITGYCDRKKLTPRERIEIFRQVCSAVQHAHQKAIIHRDIKPANILIEEVDDRPVPKVIDFGIAKAMGSPLTDLKFNPSSGQVVGTPEYMPPEQARGDLDIDTRADIYSLGVLLYELLIGAPPFSRKELEEVGIGAILKKIENDPPLSPSDRLSSMGEEMDMVADDRHIAPSQLRKLVRGDLDWIVMKALEKPRNLRYETAGAFATDIDCFLENRPLPSRRRTVIYRAGKFIRRNRLLVSALGSIAVIVLAAALIGHYQKRQNARERAEILIETLVNTRVERLPVILVALRPLGKLTGGSLERLAADPKIETRARAQIALIQQDPGRVGAAMEFLLEAEPDELTVYLALLEEHGAELSPAAWAALLDEGLGMEQRLNAAAVSATLTPGDPRWAGLGEKIAGWLVRSGAVDDPRWRSLLRPVALPLVGPLRKIYEEENISSPKATAAAALADYLQGDRREMLSLLEAARGPFQLAAITSVLGRSPDAASLLGDEVERPLPVLADEEAHRAAAEKRARLGLALLELDLGERAWPMFRYHPDPETRTHLIHGLADYSIDPEILLSRLEQETDPGTVSAILIALGEFDLAYIPLSRRASLRPALEDYYSEATDAGVRSAVEWLLKRWGMADKLAELDRPLLGQPLDGGRNWYLTKGGDFTMVLLPTPVAGFKVGSPLTEKNRSENEGQVPVGSDRRVAIATKEVTVAQFVRFAKAMNDEKIKKRDPEAGVDAWDGLDAKHPSPESAMCGISLKEAALFCWWLSREEGLGDAQCYLFEGEEFKDGDPVLVEGYLDKGGYRLPTEAEWELACRGGTTGARHFGTLPDLLAKYAWHLDGSGGSSRPVGSLRPNPFGLFDTLGNVTEWCQDRYWESYRPDEAGSIFKIEEVWKVRFPSPDGGAYCYRGGSFLHPPRYVRSAWRNSTNYPNHPFSGFRIARTIKD